MNHDWKCENCGGYNSPRQTKCLGCNHPRDKVVLTQSQDISFRKRPDRILSDPLLSRISPFFDEDIIRILDTTVQDREHIIWSGNIAKFGGSSLYDPIIRFGYQIITSDRFISVLFASDDSYKPLFGLPKMRREFLEVRNMKEITGEYVSGFENVVLLPPTYPLSEKERKTRVIHERKLQNLTGEISQREFRVDGAIVKILVEMGIDFYPNDTLWVIYFGRQDAQEVYELVQDMNKRERGDLVEQLEKLAKLYQENSLTSEEYDAAKRKLLGISE